MEEGDSNLPDENRLAELLAAYEPTNSTALPKDWDQLAPDTRARLEQNRSVIDRLSRLHMLAPTKHEAQPPRRFGRFLLRGRLGAGGCGVVFLAKDPLLGREVALKVPRPDTLVSADLQRRFLREAQAAAVLSHPNILPVFEANAVGSLCYTASEYCPGPDLAAWLKGATRPIPIKDAVRVVATLATGIGYAHRRGVVHRDLKPSNVLLTPLADAKLEQLGSFVPRLTDFGFAKLMEPDQTATQTGTLIGTPLYMAPEQAQGRTEAIGPPTDVYALGMVLQELLAGRHPLVGCSTPQVLHRIVYEPPLCIRSLRSDVHRDLEAICIKCLEKEPVRRYQDGDALASDLARFLAGEPTHARPVRWPEQLRMWVRRNPVVTAFTLLVGITLFLFAGVGWLYQSNLADKNTALLNALDREQTATNEQERQRELAQSRYRLLRRQAYLSGIRNAAVEVEQNRLTDRMIGFQESDNEEDLRGFEWYYLNRISRANRIWGWQKGPVSLGNVTADGRWGVSVAGRELQIWDARSGTASATWRHNAELSTVAAVSSDGQFAAVPLRREDGILVFKKGNPVPLVIEETCGDFTIHIEFAVGNQLVVHGNNGILHIIDSSTGKVNKTLCVDGYKVQTMDVCNDDITLIVTFSNVHLPGGVDGVTPVVEYDFLTNRETRYEAIPARTTETICSHDGRFLLFKSAVKGQVCIWDLKKATAGTQFTFPSGQAIKQLGRMRDGRLAAGTWPDSAGGAQDIAIAIWDPRTDKWESSTLAVPCPVHSARFLPDGQRLLVGGKDSSVLTVQLEQTKRVTGWSVSGKYEAWAVAISPDGQTIVTGGDDHYVRLWDARTGTRRVELKDHGALVTKAVFARSGEWFATGSFDGKVFVRDAQSGTTTKVFTHGPLVRVLATSPDGRMLAAAGNTDEVSVWDVESANRRFRLSGTSSVIHTLAFTADGKHLLAPVNETELGWWEVSSGSQLHHVNLRLRPSCMALSLDGKTLAVGYETGQIVFLDSSDGQELRRASGPYSRLNSIAFSQDGKTLAAGAVDGSVRLWQVSTAIELFAIQKGGIQINEVAFSPDGAYLAATRHDGRLLIWPAK